MEVHGLWLSRLKTGVMVHVYIKVHLQLLSNEFQYLSKYGAFNATIFFTATVLICCNIIGYYDKSLKRI